MAKVHMDATRTAAPVRSSLCGMTAVETTHDASRATCKMCLARLRGEKPASRGATRPSFMDPVSLAGELHIELGLGAPTDLSPRAPAPPVFTPGLWASSCRSTDAPCRSCTLCEWYEQVQRWSFVVPSGGGHDAPKRTRGVRWGSVAAALRALVNYERVGRGLRATTGPTLERQRLQLGPAQPVTSGAGQERNVDDIVHVAKALERAYASSHCRIPEIECARVLLERTAGALPELTPWEVLGERYALPVDELKSIVRRGQRAVESDLLERGLVAPMRARAPREGESKWRAEDAF